MNISLPLILRRVSSADNSMQCEAVTIRGIEGALKSLANQKAPRPNGFSASFFKHF